MKPLRVKTYVPRAARIRDLLQANPDGMTAREIKKALKLRENINLISKTLSTLRDRGQLLAIQDASDGRVRRWAFNGIPKTPTFNSHSPANATPQHRLAGEPESVEEFLARGGEIEQLPPGISGFYTLKASPTFSLDARRRPELPFLDSDMRRTTDAV